MNVTSIKWEKKGLAIKPAGNLWWMRSHSMLPTPLHIESSLYRIYFAGRNDRNQSHVGYALIDLAEPEKVLEMSFAPVLSPGRLGTFDDNGVLPSCFIRRGNDLYMYYIGFKPGGTTRMDLFGGLAISRNDGESFERWSEAPIIDRNRVNPFINTAPWVVEQDDGRLRMFYVAGVEWVHKDLPRYNIQTALSADGRQWNRDGTVAIDFGPGENALARPYVVRDGSNWQMWFSAKGDYYLPQYAESDDGIHWQRCQDAVDLTPTLGGPDAEMICYAIVLRHEEQFVMFYNGNGYGINGICAAIGLARD
jgi:hypothetical protein